MLKNQYKVEFTFGIGFDKDKQPICSGEAANCLERIGAMANARFGGWTMTTTEGSWVNAQGYTFREKSRILTIFLDDNQSDNLIWLTAESIKEILHQESVLVCLTPVRTRFI